MLAPASIFLINFGLPSAPISEFFLSLPWARKISLVGAQIFILIGFAHLCRDSANQVHLFALAAPSIDVATAVQGERGGKLAWPSLSRSPQSPLHLHCNGKDTKFLAHRQLFSCFWRNNADFVMKIAIINLHPLHFLSSSVDS